MTDSLDSRHRTMLFDILANCDGAEVEEAMAECCGTQEDRDWVWDGLEEAMARIDPESVT